MKYFSISLLIFLAFSCQNTSSDPIVQPEETNPEFEQFLSKFKIVDLPFVHHLIRGENLAMNYSKLDLKSKDSSYVNHQNSDEIYCYGRLANTADFYTLIYYFTADDYYPVVASYTKAGKLISQEALIVNGCGGDCGLTSCSSSGRINKDFSIFCSDTINYEFHCDDEGEPISNSAEIFSEQIRGQIDNKGKIHLEPQQRVLVSKSKDKLAQK